MMVNSVVSKSKNERLKRNQTAVKFPYHMIGSKTCAAQRNNPEFSGIPPNRKPIFISDDKDMVK